MFQSLILHFIVQQLPITLPSLENHGGGYKQKYHVQFQSCNFRLVFWSLVKLHLREKVYTEVMQFSGAWRIRKRAAWKLPGLLGRAQNAISIGSWLERPWFHFKVLYDSAHPFTSVPPPAFSILFVFERRKRFASLSQCSPLSLLS